MMYMCIDEDIKKFYFHVCTFCMITVLQLFLEDNGLAIIGTNFLCEDIPKEISNRVSLSVILQNNLIPAPANSSPKLTSFFCLLDIHYLQTL